MFEQTLIPEAGKDKKRYTVLVGLSLQVLTLAALIVVPLIYTQVLPHARLRSVFAAPMPPAPALPKAPPTTVRLISAPRMFNPIDKVIVAKAVVPIQEANLAPPADMQAGLPTGNSLTIGAPDGFQVKPPDPPQPPVVRSTGPKRVRLSGSLEESQLIHKVQPTYPKLAVQVHVHGAVEFTAVISKTGTIENLQLISGHPMLVAAARDAILQWRYKPTILNGEPVEVITDIRVNFTLNE